MAQATHNPAVTRTEIVEVTPETITLTLSMEEAKALLAVSQRIGGSAVNTRRVHLDKINNALWDVGVRDEGQDIDDKHGRIYFNAVA